MLKISQKNDTYYFKGPLESFHQRRIDIDLSLTKWAIIFVCGQKFVDNVDQI